jgi:acyl-CoA synthetase (AMP-forming)/AMP-acid ligase II
LTVQSEPATIAAVTAGLRRFGRRPALVDAAGQVTEYADLVSASARLGNALFAEGLKPGDRFAFFLPNGRRIVECYLACATSGIVGVPLAARVTLDDMEHQLRDSGALVLVYDEKATAVIDAMRERIPALRTIGEESLSRLQAAVGDELPPTTARPDDPFCVMFTGGTTGVSKAAVLTQGGWACCVIDTVAQLDLQASDRHAVVLPMTHAAWFTLAAHLHVGAVTHLRVDWNPKSYLELVERERLTTLHMIPTLLGDLVEVIGEEDVSSARLLTVAGSPMPIEMYRRARSVFGDILGNIYGLTEATGPVTYLLPGDMSDEKIRSGGRAGRFIEIDIRDVREDVQEADGGPRVGEIALRGPQITPGYLNRPDETAAAFEDGWFCTGDVGYLDDDGFLFILDRKKDMIKSGGFNIYPKEIEEVLYRHPSVFEAAVIGLPDPRWIEVVTAVAAVSDPSIGAAELESHCREHLPAYKVPKAIHLLAALPRTDFGKFDKKQLQHRFSAPG